MTRTPLTACRQRNQSRWPGRRTSLPSALAAVLGLSACVAPPELPPMRVAPSYRLDHAGAGLAQGYALLARRYEGEARWPEALQAWLKAVQAAPGDADLHNALGQAHAGLGEHEAAVAALRRAVELAPDQAALHNNLGYALMRAQRNEEARAVLLQALALQPGYARAQANLLRLEGPAGTAQAAAAPISAAQETATAAAVPPPAAAPSASRVPAAEPEPPAVPTVPTTASAVEIANGNGVEGMAACMAEALRSQVALRSVRLRNALPYDTATTVVRYRAGHAESAQMLARQLPGGAPTLAGLDRADSLDLRIVLGHDLRARGPCSKRG